MCGVFRFKQQRHSTGFPAESDQSGQSGRFHGLARDLPHPQRMSRLHWFVSALLLLLVATPSIANAADPSRDGFASHIRTTDDRLRRLLEQGTRTSPTLRTLVHRLLDSDVVVYLWCEGSSPAIPDGRLTFVSSVGGRRYVVVRLVRLASRERQIAILAHELQHAVEIADAPDVIDHASLEHEYRRIGYVSAGSMAEAISFDTTAAVQAGISVLREVMLADD
jgi:hypothetical protein